MSMHYFCYFCLIPDVSCRWCGCFYLTECHVVTFMFTMSLCQYCAYTMFLFPMWDYETLHWLVIQRIKYLTHLFFSQMSLHVFRIRPLSEALGDLYMQFNTLKVELGKLTSKLDSVEGFVDDLKDGRFARPQRPPSVGLRFPLRAQMRTPDRGMIKGPPLRRRSQIP